MDYVGAIMEWGSQPSAKGKLSPLPANPSGPQNVNGLMIANAPVVDLAASSKSQTMDMSSTCPAPNDNKPLDADFYENSKLPTCEDIKQAFQILQNFKLENILPPNLKNPLEDLPPEKRKELDKLNMMLEENVDRLFNPAERADIDSIREALTNIVTQTDYYLTNEAAKAKLEKTTERSVKQIRTPILQFYPHLLQLIKALLAYAKKFEYEVHIRQNEPPSFIYRAWQQVLTYLMSIQTVIAFATTKYNLSVDNYPTSFQDIIMRTENETRALQNDINQKKAQITALIEKQQEHDKKQLEINELYMGVPDKLTTARIELNNLQNRLSDMQNPDRIALHNVQELKKREDQTFN